MSTQLPRVAPIQRTEIDGVRTVWFERPGPMTASLAFRVGRADERLARAGVSHLLEHLVLFPFGGEPDHNGLVDALRMVFHTTGPPGAIVEFFRRLGRCMREVPVDRLDIEKQVLRAEAARRSWSMQDTLAMRRYGAATYGLLGYAELGLPAISAADVVAWAQRHLTVDNAVLTLTGPPPAGLRLELAAGTHHPPPAASDFRGRLPAWYPGDVDGVSVDMVLPRGPAAQAFSEILGARLRAVLRFERGISYSPSTTYLRRDGTHASLFAFVDALTENRQAVLDGTLSILESLTTSGATEVEMEERKAAFRAGLEQPGIESAFAESLAFDLLMGRPARGVDEWTTTWMDLTTDNVRTAALSGRDGALACVPDGVQVPESWHRAPDWSDAPVTGRTRLWIGSNPTPEQAATDLILGDEGVSVTDSVQHRTVRYADAAAVMDWPDGRRVLIGLDGATVNVEPNLWERSKSIPAEIDRHADPETIIVYPARDPKIVPKRPFVPSPWVMVALLVGLLALDAALLAWAPRQASGLLTQASAAAVVLVFMAATFAGLVFALRTIARWRYRRALRKRTSKANRSHDGQ